MTHHKSSTKDVNVNGMGAWLHIMLGAQPISPWHARPTAVYLA